MIGASGIHGFKELDAALAELEKRQGVRIANKALRAASEPVAEEMRARTKGSLRESIGVGNKLSVRQRAISRSLGGAASIQMHTGPNYALGFGGRSGHLIEFGTGQRVQTTTGRATGRVQAKPFARPAWDNNKMKSLEIIKKVMWAEIARVAKLQARKTARLAKLNLGGGSAG